MHEPRAALVLNILYMKAIITMTMAAAMIAACGTGKDANRTADTALTTDSVKYENKSKKAEVTITADYPTDGNPLLVNAVREYISENLGGEYTGSLAEKDSLADFYGKKMTAEMEETASEFDADAIPPMVQNETFKLNHETERYVTYTMSNYTYMGGAHGMSVFTGTTFRKSDGRKFGMDMLRNTGSDNFHMLIKEGVKEYFSQGEGTAMTDQALKDCLLTDHDVNFLPLPASAPYLTEKGVVFIYQQYEIAPYAAGMPTFIIPYSKMTPYLTVTAQRLVE